MSVTLLAFGIVKDIFKAPFQQIELKEGTTVALLKQAIEQKFPEIKKIKSYVIAVNNEYATDEQLLNFNDEVAIIPPVSGG